MTAVAPSEALTAFFEQEAAEGSVGMFLIDLAHKPHLAVDASGPIETVCGAPAAFVPLGGGPPVILPRTWLSAALSVADGDRMTLPVSWDESSKTFRVHLPDDAGDCKVVPA